jgi:sugar lactone lactonase YvrE
MFLKQVTWSRDKGWRILSGAVWVAISTATFGQLPPARPTVVGNLELVASISGDQPAGIAVSKSGRVFISFPRHDGDVQFTVAELRNNRPVAYPTAELNRADVRRPADTLFSVQTFQVDESDHLWMLDTGTLQFGKPLVPGAAKLLEVDLASDTIVRTVELPVESLVANSALKDFRLDFNRGRDGVAFITDSAPNAEALIVLDLASRRTVRRLVGSPTVSAHPGRTAIVGYEPLLVSGDRKHQERPTPWLVGLNALELSANNETVYFSAFTRRRLYAVNADLLADFATDDGKVTASVRNLGDIGVAGHFVLDAKEQLYFMDMEQNAIYRRESDGRIALVVVDPRLIWPDTMTIGPDQYLYVTTSQHDRRAEFHDGRELRQQPYGVYRVFIGSDPRRGLRPKTRAGKISRRSSTRSMPRPERGVA